MDYAIENSLDYVELNEFLDHVADYDKDAKYSELSDLIE